MILNSGEFYGTNPRTANLELLARFFDKYPTYTDKVFLSVKGGTGPADIDPDSSPENIRRSVDTVLKALRGTKKIDLFECARVDSRVAIEDNIATLANLVKEGKFDHIGMSECAAATLRRGNAVHPIAAVEIEVSPWSYSEETQKVIATAKELHITVIAYSPLGRGFLTGQIKKPEDLEEGDFRRNLTRFSEENFNHNMEVVNALKAIADKKNITAAQLSIAWVSALGSHVIPVPGSSNKTRTLENLAGGDVDLSSQDLAEINQVLTTHKFKGDRYYGLSDKDMHLWG